MRSRLKTFCPLFHVIYKKKLSIAKILQDMCMDNIKCEVVWLESSVPFLFCHVYCPLAFMSWYVSKLLKMNGHGKLCGRCPVSTGRPSSARTPRAKHCLSVLLYSMALLQQSFRSYFIFHEKGRCTHRRSRQNLRASIHWLVEFKVCRGLKMYTDYVHPVSLSVLLSANLVRLTCCWSEKSEILAMEQ